MDALYLLSYGSKTGEVGIEPTRDGVKVRCLTTWLLPNMYGGGGRIRTYEAFATDLQSAPVGRFGTPPGSTSNNMQHNVACYAASATPACHGRRSAHSAPALPHNWRRSARSRRQAPARPSGPASTGYGLDRFASVGSTRRRASTSDRFTLSSPRGLLSSLSGTRHLEAGFALRCFQRLSLPNVATQRCGWHHNWNTSGWFLPVLSYWGRPLSRLLRPRQIGTELSHDVLNPARVPL